MRLRLAVAALVLAAVIGTVAALSSGSPARAASKRPNIVFVLTDDLS